MDYVQSYKNVPVFMTNIYLQNIENLSLTSLKLGM
jgi:hypothetical protein